LKKVISYILICLVFFNSFGYLFVYYELQHLFKSEAFGKLDNFININELVSIKINKKDFSSCNNGEIEFNDKEISYNGFMYDIYKIDEDKDFYLLHCLSDKNEDNLNLVFKKFIDDNLQNTSANKTYSNLLKDFRITTYTPEYFTYKNFNNPTYNNFIQGNYLINHTLEIPTPPPKLA
jgi:hypothetical protein